MTAYNEPLDIIYLISDHFSFVFNLKECGVYHFLNLGIVLVRLLQVTVTHLREIVRNVTGFVCISHKAWSATKRVTK